MKTQTTIISAILAINLMALGGCTSANETTNIDGDTKLAVAPMKARAGYLKPGAAIEFSHNYDGNTQPGEVENFQVFVKGGSLKGAVNVKMENPDGLNIYSDRNNQLLDIAEDAPDGLDHTMDLRVSAQEPGRYYLKFLATSDQGGDTPMMRAFSIAIQVGDQPYVPELGKGMTAEETPSGEKIITMDATETIDN